MLDNAAEFARILGCPVTSNAPWSGVSLPLQHGGCLFGGAGPNLAASPRRHANEILARRRRAPVLRWRFNARWLLGSGAHESIGRIGMSARASTKTGKRTRVISEVARRCAQSAAGRHCRVDAGDRGGCLPPGTRRRQRSIVPSGVGGATPESVSRHECVKMAG